MTYPIFMVIFLGCMVLAMFVWIIPKFSEVYSQLGASLPGATKKMMDASAWVTDNLGFMFFNFILVFLTVFLISKTQRGGFVLDSIKLKIPVW